MCYPDGFLAQLLYELEQPESGFLRFAAQPLMSEPYAVAEP
ncbi:hypothetical protein [Mumia zhuanghuii]|nr:hypothetical protein [Mumia zhuanghuii]